jgi:hypothetical protein
MKRVVVLEVERCFFCYHRQMTGGLAGDAEYCSHPTFKEWQFLYPDDYKGDFPLWCPLPKKRIRKALGPVKGGKRE